MKKCIYDFWHGKRWADFSGDYNPIHFDLTAAAEFNQTALIVHGMRVIADIKKHLLLQNEYTKTQPPVSVRFSAKFENLVLCGTEYSLCSYIKNKKTLFKLEDPSRGAVHIRGSVSEASPPGICHFIAEKNVTRKYLDKVNQFWPAEIEQSDSTFLPLVMFRELFCNPELLPANLLHECTPVHSLGALLVQKKLIQTHYDLYYNTSLHHTKEHSFEGMIIRTGKPSITGDIDYGWLIQVQMVVETNSTRLMQISVTLKIISDSQGK